MRAVRDLVAIPLALTAAVAVASPAPAPAQTAEEILDTALERYEQRMEGIRTYRVTQRVLGMTTTNRFVKTTMDGHPVFVQAGRDSATGRMPRGWGNPYRLFPRLADRAELAGRTPVDGHETWRVVVTDFEGLDLEAMTPEQAPGQFRPQRLELFLDADSHAIRRLTMEGKMATDTASRALSLDARFQDYREVEGMLHPFRVSLRVQGMSAAVPPDELERARRQLDRIRQQLEQLPEEEREKARQAMGGQLEQLRQIVESGDVETEVVVTDLQVNEGAGGEGPGG